MVPSSLTGDHTDLLRPFSLPFMIVWTHTMFSSTRFSSQSIQPSPGQEPSLWFSAVALSAFSQHCYLHTDFGKALQMGKKAWL